MRLLCLNQFVPPDEAPTARLLGELGDLLATHGWQVACLGAGGRYAGTTGWRRWRRDLLCHLRLFWQGMRSARPDAILCLSDPPALLFTASWISRLRRVPLVHWAMDVYPQIAAALAEVSTSGPIYRLVNAAMKSGYARCQLIACLDRDMLSRLHLEADPRGVLCPPWVPQGLHLPPAGAPDTRPDAVTVRWLYSGNLGRAHDYETMLRAQQILESRGLPFELVVQGAGASRKPAIKLAGELGLRHCVWRDYAPRADLVTSLLQAHVLVASQVPSTQGLLWPSKLALFRLLPRAIAWIGPRDGAIAEALRTDAALRGIFAPGDAEGLAGWLADHQEQLVREAALPWNPVPVQTSMSRTASARGSEWNERLQTLLPATLSKPLTRPA